MIRPTLSAIPLVRAKEGTLQEDARKMWEAESPE